jgi:hypothetical protein
MDDGLDFNTRRSNRTRNSPKLFTFKDSQAARNWQVMANSVSGTGLYSACQVESKVPPINLNAVHPTPFMPPPMRIRSVLKMSDSEAKKRGVELM